MEQRPGDGEAGDLFRGHGEVRFARGRGDEEHDRKYRHAVGREGDAN